MPLRGFQPSPQIRICRSRQRLRVGCRGALRAAGLWLTVVPLHPTAARQDFLRRTSCQSKCLCATGGPRALRALALELSRQMVSGKSLLLHFPNAVALNAVGCRNTQMSAKTNLSAPRSQRYSCECECEF